MVTAFKSALRIKDQNKFRPAKVQSKLKRSPAKPTSEVSTNCQEHFIDL